MRGGENRLCGGTCVRCPKTVGGVKGRPGLKSTNSAARGRLVGEVATPGLAIKGTFKVDANTPAA